MSKLIGCDVEGCSSLAKIDSQELKGWRAVSFFDDFGPVEMNANRFGPIVHLPMPSHGQVLYHMCPKHELPKFTKAERSVAPAPDWVQDVLRDNE